MCGHRPCQLIRARILYIFACPHVGFLRTRASREAGVIPSPPMSSCETSTSALTAKMTAASRSLLMASLLSTQLWCPFLTALDDLPWAWVQLDGYIPGTAQEAKNKRNKQFSMSSSATPLMQTSERLPRGVRLPALAAGCIAEGNAGHNVSTGPWSSVTCDGADDGGVNCHL